MWVWTGSYLQWVPEGNMLIKNKNDDQNPYLANWSSFRVSVEARVTTGCSLPIDCCELLGCIAAGVNVVD